MLNDGEQLQSIPHSTLLSLVVAGWLHIKFLHGAPGKDLL